MVVDVKRPTAGARPDVRAALAWTERTVEARGWRYQVWTGADPTVLRNVRLIAAGRRAGIGLDGLRDVIEHQDGAPLRFGDVEAMLRGCSAPRLLVLAGLWQGVLRCDMTLPISSDTLVEVA